LSARCGARGQWRNGNLTRLPVIGHARRSAQTTDNAAKPQTTRGARQRSAAAHG